MYQRLAGLSDDLMEIVREFMRDNGMLGSIVAFGLVFGGAMAVVTLLIIVAGLLA